MKDLIKRIKKLEKRDSETIKELNEKREELKNVCKHEKTKTTDFYYSGDLFNKSYIQYTKTCIFCDKIIDKWKSENGSFG